MLITHLSTLWGMTLLADLRVGWAGVSDFMTRRMSSLQRCSYYKLSIQVLCYNPEKISSSSASQSCARPTSVCTEGGNVPFIMSQREDGYFELVCMTHVHGIMDG
jgi:hypothetical protein